jgi:hypothetical protein
MKSTIKSNVPLAVLDEHPDWLNPLYAEFERRGVPYKKIDISATSYNPAKEEILPFYVNRLSPSAAKRGHQAAHNYTLNYLQFLESSGARVINGSHTVLLEISKAQQAALLHRLSVPHPKTLVTNSFDEILNNIDDFSFPLLIKPNCGGSGMGITKFNSKKELIDAIKSQTLSLPQEQMVVVQEFIQPKDGHIVRVETIGGKVIYAMKVFTSGTFNLCPSDSCDLTRNEVVTSNSASDIGYCVADTSTDVRFELYPELPNEIKVSIETIVAEAGLECAGIEYVTGANGDWYIYDINALSILRSSFKEEYGIDGWRLLADYFIDQYHHALAA